MLPAYAFLGLFVIATLQPLYHVASWFNDPPEATFGGVGPGAVFWTEVALTSITASVASLALYGFASGHCVPFLALYAPSITVAAVIFFLDDPAEWTALRLFFITMRALHEFLVLSGVNIYYRQMMKAEAVDDFLKKNYI